MQEWQTKASKMSLNDAKALATKMGFEFYFDWERCRTEEGYYRVKGSVDFCVARCKVIFLFTFRYLMLLNRNLPSIVT